MTAEQRTTNRNGCSADLEAASRALHRIAEVHMLSKLPRIGLALAGVQSPQSIAVHCYETAIISYFLCQSLDEPVDVGKVLVMSLFHEAGETRVANQPRRARPYLGEAKDQAEMAVIADVMHGLPEDMVSLMLERDEGKSIESRVSLAAEDLQVSFTALMCAKEKNGDMTEFQPDVDQVDARNIPLAVALVKVIGNRFARYMGSQTKWGLGHGKI